MGREFWILVVGVCNSFEIPTKTYYLIQIVTVLSCRLQGKRANKAKKMIKELLENDTGEES